jgi:hypothetical protein
MIYYRTLDGTKDYAFSFEATSDGTIRAYIESQPDYGERDRSLHATHRLQGGGRYYICWEPLPRTEEDARAVAARWGECTERYIKDGTRF